MTNYYVELGLDRSSSIEELEQQLKALKKRWTARASSAATTDKRQQAERMVDLIREASETLLVKDKKAKYDKQLDKDPNASSAQPSTQQQAPVNVDSANMAGAALLDLVEQFYDNSNYNQAIAVAKKAIATGNVSVELYRLLALCYAERGDESSSFNTLREMLQTYSDDAEAHFCNARLCLQVLSNHAKDARPSIDWLIENGYNDNGAVIALDVEYDIDSGDKALADSKIDEYLAHNGNDQEFRQTVCRAIAQYADVHKLTEYGGDVYFETEQDMKDWIALYDRALQIYPDGSLRKVYDTNKAFTKRTFLSANWMGILCGLLYTFAGFGSGVPLVSIVSLLLTIGMIYFSLVPKWQLLRYQYKKHLVGAYEVFRIINYVLSIFLRIGWEIMKFIFRLVFAFI